MRIAAVAMVILLATSGAAAASGPVKAPSPRALDGQAVSAYLLRYAPTMETALLQADRAVERWVEAPHDSARARRALRDHARATKRVNASQRALRRDLARLGGCRNELARSHAWMARAHNDRQRAMRSHRLRRLIEAERTISYEAGRFEGLVVDMLICLVDRGWRFRPPGV